MFYMGCKYRFDSQFFHFRLCWKDVFQRCCLIGTHQGGKSCDIWFRIEFSKEVPKVLGSTMLVCSPAPTRFDCGCEHNFIYLKLVGVQEVQHRSCGFNITFNCCSMDTRCNQHVSKCAFFLGFVPDFAHLFRFTQFGKNPESRCESCLFKPLASLTTLLVDRGPFIISKASQRGIHRSIVDLWCLSRICHKAGLDILPAPPVAGNGNLCEKLLLFTGKWKSITQHVFDLPSGAVPRPFSKFTCQLLLGSAKCACRRLVQEDQKGWTTEKQMQPLASGTLSFHVSLRSNNHSGKSYICDQKCEVPQSQHISVCLYEII